MKFLKIARRPAWYSDALYAGAPEMMSASFDNQFRWYCGDFFGPADTWQTYLPNDGLDARDLICGVGPMDKAWWAEFGSGPMSNSIIPVQIKHYKPELLFLEGIESFTNAEIDAFRDVLPLGTPVAGLTGTDIRTNPSLRAVDIVFTCMKELASEIKSEGGAAYFLPHSFDPRILAQFPNQRVIVEPINFIGNLVSGNHMHDERRKTVEAVAAGCSLSVYSNLERNLGRALGRYAMASGAYALAKSIATAGVPVRRIPGRHLRKAATWDAAPALGYHWKLARKARKGVYGLGQYELLRGARTTINIHAGLAKNYAANMRLFEATGIGTCLMTDASRDIADFFEPDFEAVTFSSVAEAVEKARFIVDHPDEADKIAAKGHQRTLRDHTFAARAPILIAAIKTYFERRKLA
jgi:spore maturation protein CgeB